MTVWCGCSRAGFVLAGALFGPVCSARAQRAGAGTDSATWAATASSQHPAVPATVGAWQRPHDGGVARVIQSDSAALPRLGTFSNFLASRIPGVLVQRPSGVTGAGSRIHIRGISSVVLPGDPVVIIDGVRVNNATTVSTVDVGGQVPSRLDDLDPEDIERVEVLSGPASAARFGGDAADGAILVTTRHGRPGHPTWRVHTQYGAVNDVTRYPANFNRPGTDPLTGQTVASCSLDLASRGGCVPGALTSWNPLENVSPFHTGTSQRHGLSVGGGSSAVTYYAAGEYEREDGVYANNDREQTHLRANVTGHPSSTVALTLNASHVDGMVRLPIGGDDFLNVIAAGLSGSATDDPVRRGYNEIPPGLGSAQGPAALFHSMGAPERMRRSTIGVSARWQALSWLQSMSTVGLDRVHLSSERRVLSPPLGALPGDSVVSRAAGTYRTDVLTVQSEWRATYGHAQSLSARSSIGVQYHRQRLEEWYDSMATRFLAGGGSVSGGSTGSTQPKAATTGAYVRQSIAWRNRLVLTAGLRREFSYHTFFVPHGRNPALTDVSANVVWALSSEPFFPHASWIDALRLRAAYGNTGRFFDDVVAFPNFLTSTLPFLPSAPAVPPSPDAVPQGPIAERTREVEAGMDATLFHGRLDAALTYYDKQSAHLMDVVVTAPSSSATGGALLPDQAAIHTRGYEMLVHASLLRAGAATVDLTVSGATNHGTFDRTGSLDRSVGGYTGHRFTFADANGDGIISRGEVQVDDAVVFLGSAVPTRELSLGPTVGLFGWLRLSALFDYEGGFKQYNANEAERCGAFRNCRALYDPTAPLADQAAAIVETLGSGVLLPDAGYIQDASFWKLRDVALTFAVPRRWARKLAASDVSLTLAGRNLATWTDYPGLDPEIMATPADPLSRRDLWTQPPVRYLTARLDVTW